MELETENLIENIISKGLGLNYYENIIQNVNKVNVLTDLRFQKNFNFYYKVRRNAEWRNQFYTLFENSKLNKNLSYSSILTCLYEKTNQIEASFSSKLLATLNPEMPIWDQYVLKNLKLELKGKTQMDKLHNAINIYDCIIDWYSKYLHTDNAKQIIELFNKNLPSYKWITDIKKIDYILWSIH